MRVMPVDATGGRVDVMLRPDDCALQAAGDNGNGAIDGARYEGGSWLYTVVLDGGERVRVRTSHENRLAANERVSVTVTSGQPLAAFSSPG